MNPENNTGNLPTETEAELRAGDRLNWIILAAFLVLGALAAGFFLGRAEANSKQSLYNASVVTTDSSDSGSIDISFIKSIGYPADFAAKAVHIELGVPGFMQAARVASTDQNQGYAQYFINNSADELGRWALGTPANPSDPGSEISILAVSKAWQSSAGKNSLVLGSSLATAADKQKFLADLKTQSANCIKSSKTGFQTQDQIFDVCVSKSTPKDSYRPGMTVKGYGEAQGIPMVFVGQVNIYDGLQFKSQDEENKAIADFNSGNLSTRTQQVYNSIIASLSQSTTIVTNK
jgi:hypothetical protein